MFKMLKAVVLLTISHEGVQKPDKLKNKNSVRGLIGHVSNKDFGFIMAL